MSGKGKVPALKYALPGAGAGWYAVPGLGIFHTEIAVPVDEQRAKDFIKQHKDRVAADREAWDEFEAEQEEAGNRPNGRIPFGDAVEGKDGEIVYRDPPPHVELVQIGEQKAEEGRLAQLEIRGKSRRMIRAFREGSPDEQVQAVEEADTLAATEEV